MRRDLGSDSDGMFELPCAVQDGGRNDMTRRAKPMKRKPIRAWAAVCVCGSGPFLGESEIEAKIEWQAHRNDACVSCELVELVERKSPNRRKAR